MNKNCSQQKGWDEYGAPDVYRRVMFGLDCRVEKRHCGDYRWYCKPLDGFVRGTLNDIIVGRGVTKTMNDAFAICEQAAKVYEGDEEKGAIK